MLKSKFLNTAVLIAVSADAVPTARRSNLFRRRAAMRFNVAAENDCSMNVSPMTTALVSVAELRTGCPEVPSTSDLIIADAEDSTEMHDVVAHAAPATEVKKAGRKRKKRVPSAARPKPSRRKTRTTAMVPSSG